MSKNLKTVRSALNLCWTCIFLAVVSLGTGCAKSPPPPPSQQEVQEFRNALNDGDAAIVDRLLSAKPGLVNVRDESGRTPLAVAEEKGDEEMAQVLRRHGGTL